MNEILQANVFFFITSAGVIVLTLLACVLLYQLIRIVQLVRRIVERVEAGSEVLKEDLEDLRENLNPAAAISFIMRLVSQFTPTRRRRSRKTSE